MLLEMIYVCALLDVVNSASPEIWEPVVLGESPEMYPVEVRFFSQPHSDNRNDPIKIRDKIDDVFFS